MNRLIVQNSMFEARKNRHRDMHLRQTLFEPIYVVAACLMWGAILPITGLFCAGVDVYDKVTAPGRAPTWSRTASD